MKGEIDQVVERAPRSETSSAPGNATSGAPGSGTSGATLRARLRGLRRALDLLRALTESDLRFRYGRGPGRLRPLAFLEPFALVGVYLLLAHLSSSTGPGTAPGLSLAAAIVPFQLVISTVGDFDGRSRDHRRPILLNMAFERNLMPISSALTECASFVASFFIVVVMMAAYRVGPTFALLWLPLVDARQPLSGSRCRVRGEALLGRLAARAQAVPAAQLRPHALLPRPWTRAPY